MTYPHEMLMVDGRIRAVYTMPSGQRFYLRDGEQVFCSEVKSHG